MTDTTDLTSIISATVAAKMTPEFIDKEVNSRVEKLVIESIDRALRTYSDTGKLIEKAVEDALRVDKIDLPSYGSTVAKMVKAAIEHRVAEVVQGRLKQDVEDILQLAPQSVKISALAEAMLESHKSDGSYGEVTTFIMEESEYGHRWLYLDDETVYEERKKFSCKYRLMVSKDGKIASAYIGDRASKAENWIGRSYGFEQRLRGYVACGTIVEFDTEYPCTSVGDY